MRGLHRSCRFSPRDAEDALDGDWDQALELAYEPGADGSAELVEPLDLSGYAGAKAFAERGSASAVADRLLLARPGLIVGPGDPSD